MRRKILFTLFILLFCKSVSALTYGGCDFATTARLKQIVGNATISYDYRIVNNEAYFDITVSNLTKDIYVSDNYFDKNYYQNNGEVIIKNVKSKSITLKFNSNIKSCQGLLLGTKYEQLPIYNKYYNHKVCSDMEGFSYCNKWVKKEYTLKEIEVAIQKYKDSLNGDPEEPTRVIYNKTWFEKLIDFYVKYYVFILLGIIAVCSIIIAVHRKRSQFKI